MCTKTFGLKVYKVHYFSMFCIIYFNFRSGEKKNVTYKKKKKKKIFVKNEKPKKNRNLSISI